MKNVKNSLIVSFLSLLSFTGNTQTLEEAFALCSENIINSEKLTIKVDIKAVEANSKSILEQSHFILYKDENLYYSSILGVESFYDLNNDVVFILNHEEKFASISKLTKSENPFQSLIQHYDMSNIDKEVFQMKESEVDEKVKKYSLYKNEEVICDFSIDIQNHRIHSASFLDVESSLVEGVLRQPIIEMEYSYTEGKKNYSPYVFFGKNNESWKLKSKYSEYTLYDATTL